MAANIKVKSDSQQFKSDMKEMANSIKLTSSEFQVAQTKANLFGTTQEKLQANINSLNSKLTGQNSILALQKDGFSKISLELDKYKARNVELTNSIDKKSNAIKEELKLNGENSAEYKKLVSELGKMQTEYKKNTTEIGKNETSLNGLKLKMNQAQIEIMQTKKALDDFGKELDQSGKKTKEFSGEVEKLKEKFNGVGDVAKKTGLAIGAGLVAGTGAAVISSNNTGAALNDLQVKTRMTSEEMVELGKIAREVYENGMGENIKEVTDTMALLSQTTQLTGDELKNATTNALMLSDVFDADVNDTVKTTNSLMKNFGITGDEAMTLIAQGFQNGGNVSGDLLDSLNEYSVQFSTMGFSADQFTNILIDGAESGVFSIDKIGDAIKEFTIRSKDGSKGSKEAFESLGLSADEMSKKFAKGGVDSQEAFKKTMTALNELKDPILKNTVGVQLFGTQFEDLEAGAIGALANIGTSADKSAKTLEEMASIKYSDMESQFLSIGRKLKDGLADTISNNVLPKLKEFTATITENMPLIQERISKAINIAVPLFEGFVKVIGFAIDNSNWLIPVIGALVIAFGTLKIVEGIKNLIDGYKTTVLLLKDAKLACTLATEKFAKALTAIGDFILIAITKTYEFIIAKGAETMAWISNTASTAGNTIAKGASTIAQGALSIATGAWTIVCGVATFATTALGIAFAFLTSPIGIVILAIAAIIAIGVLLYENWDYVKVKASEFGDWIVKAFNNIIDFFKNNWKEILTFMVNPFAGAFALLYKHCDGFRNKVDEIMGGIKGAFKSAGDWIKGVWDDIWDFQLPHINMPHFTFSGTMNPMKWGDLGTPSIGVDWYAKGGIMTSPTFIGMNGNNASFGGEAGAEAILPLSALWGQLEKNFNKLEQRLSSNNSQVIEITNITTLDGKVIATETTKKVIKQLTKKQKDLNGGLGIA
ncbi:phage tail tape measure protein [Clostridium gasigenes]|uniref:phage tail tape measure protein n=1 Tax=Clostridium gasigenes TaxID=94869 RepID=UPI001626E11F|nr:phage tail tape measure protein [Clostridium gasigenes]MBB6622571.1 phage tail tape measure protein [Clostridium gasigenes]